MSDFSLNELRDMAPGYVLGSLSADENAAFERALASSVELTQEIAAYRNVVARVGNIGELAPPPDLRARFLSRIAAQKSGMLPSESAAPSAPAVTSVSAATSAPDATSSPSATSAPVTTPTPAAAEPRPFTVSRGNAASSHLVPEKGPRVQWWLSGVLAVGLAASLLFAVQRNNAVTTLTASLAERDASLAARDSLLAARSTKLAQRDSALNTVLEAERNLVMVNLVSTPSDGPGIQFFWDVKKRTAMIHAFRLKPATPGRAYQLWLIKDGKPVPSLVFNADADEHGLVWGIEMPADTKGISAVAITDEPAGGSLQPTTTPFMVGALPKAAP